MKGRGRAAGPRPPDSYEKIEARDDDCGPLNLTRPSTQFRTGYRRIAWVAVLVTGLALVAIPLLSQSSPSTVSGGLLLYSGTAVSIGGLTGSIADFYLRRKDRRADVRPALVFETSEVQPKTTFLPRRQLIVKNRGPGVACGLRVSFRGLRADQTVGVGLREAWADLKISRRAGDLPIDDPTSAALAPADPGWVVYRDGGTLDPATGKRAANRKVPLNSYDLDGYRTVRVEVSCTDVDRRELDPVAVILGIVDETYWLKQGVFRLDGDGWAPVA